MAPAVYTISSARIVAEAAVSMTKKILALTPPDASDSVAMAAYLNTLTRYVAIKEEQAHLAKEELLVLWTDYFKPVIWTRIQTSMRFWKAANLLRRQGRSELHKP